PPIATDLTDARAVNASEPVIKKSPHVASPRLEESGHPLPPLTYEPRGRRDPFAHAKAAPTETGVEVGSARLVGVIRGQELWALVELPGGLAYILRPGDALGRARVIDIDLHSVTFAVAASGDEPDATRALTLAMD